MNKKIIPITITTAIILSLTACSNAKTSDKEVPEEQSCIDGDWHIFTSDRE
jgi:hypothetical protein